MSLDGIRLMERLGFDRFAVVGHDRGARVGYRMALDHPNRVLKLAVLDVIPTGEMWRRMDRKFALSYWHWLFLAQPAPLPERLIGADPDAFYFRTDRAMFDPDALADYLSAVHDTATIHAMCEDYRAGATVDAALDDADRAAGNRIGCPVLVLWSSRDRLADLDLIACWREWADDVRGEAIDAGHFLAEEAPDSVASALLGFLSE
jgi:haloacetate dehalogenase